MNKITDPEKIANFNKWLDALESNEFEQGVGRLREGDKYCCLGVACNVYQKETGIGEWVTYGDYYAFAERGSDTEFLPNSVATWLGFDSCNPMIEDGCIGEGEISATDANDDLWTFKDIAKALRETYLEPTNGNS